MVFNDVHRIIYSGEFANIDKTIPTQINMTIKQHILVHAYVMTV